jgi:hypothetical protein
MALLEYQGMRHTHRSGSGDRPWWALLQLEDGEERTKVWPLACWVVSHLCSKYRRRTSKRSILGAKACRLALLITVASTCCCCTVQHATTTVHLSFVPVLINVRVLLSLLLLRRIRDGSAPTFAHDLRCQGIKSRAVMEHSAHWSRQLVCVLKRWEGSGVPVGKWRSVMASC